MRSCKKNSHSKTSSTIGENFQLSLLLFVLDFSEPLFLLEPWIAHVLPSSQLTTVVLLLLFSHTRLRILTVDVVSSRCSTYSFEARYGVRFILIRWSHFYLAFGNQRVDIN
ncbi:hypothetical protein M9H77_16001 [Catharanthus roseus]|uniref:Uncharacterized protein n=1 Tax=Catharanthus roseus TaxID=4058 RepID=A0ACC0AYQ2_CATRO|nr:hypothetical protein M9H77_16001 [Catharanthus roseus]